MSKRTRAALIASLMVLGMGTAQGQVRLYSPMDVQYTFDGLNNPSPSVVTSHVSASPFFPGPGLMPLSATNVVTSKHWSPDPVSFGSYYSFTVTAEAGYFMDLAELTFFEKASAAGPDNFRVLTSVSGFGSSFEDLVSVFHHDSTFGGSTGISQSSFTGHTFSLEHQGTWFSDLTSLEIRIYGLNARDTEGTWSFSDVSLSGSVYTLVTPVPEPETYAMLLAGLGLLGFTMRRRRSDLRQVSGAG